MSKKDDKRVKHQAEGDEAKESGTTELLSEPTTHELTQQLNAAEQKVNEYWDRILRMQAEYDNIVRRSERDVANAHKYSLEKFVAELLPIVDSLELCVQNVPDNLDAIAHSVVDGVKLTLKMFYTALEKFAVKQVNPINQEFNPEFEQAIATESKPGVKANTVVNVLQKGYTLNNRLVRPALVVVAKA